MRRSTPTVKSHSKRWTDDRPTEGGHAPPCILPIEFGGRKLGRLAIAFASRAVATTDLDLATLMASELGGAVRIAALIDDARRLAAMDALTELPNRRAFVDAMERERSRAARHALPFSFVMIDVDHFKNRERYARSCGGVTWCSKPSRVR